MFFEICVCALQELLPYFEVPHFVPTGIIFMFSIAKHVHSEQ